LKVETLAKPYTALRVSDPSDRSAQDLNSSPLAHEQWDKGAVIFLSFCFQRKNVLPSLFSVSILIY